MMRHPVLAILLAVLLALGAQASALARGAVADAGMAVTLCTGDGPRVVMLDADGQPVAPRHHCPDCVVTAALPPAALRAASAPATSRRLAMSAPVPFGALRLPRGAPFARAPPPSA